MYTVYKICAILGRFQKYARFLQLCLVFARTTKAMKDRREGTLKGKTLSDNFTLVFLKSQPLTEFDNSESLI